jgi:hypothetical protein
MSLPISCPTPLSERSSPSFIGVLAFDAGGEFSGAAIPGNARCMNIVKITRTDSDFDDHVIS